eukprot:4752574-Heterocapsa_arctica.AAC.1
MTGPPPQPQPQPLGDIYRGWGGQSWGHLLPLVHHPPVRPPGPKAWLEPLAPPAPAMCTYHTWVNDNCQECRPFREWQIAYGPP